MKEELKEEEETITEKEHKTRNIENEHVSILCNVKDRFLIDVVTSNYISFLKDEDIKLAKRVFEKNISDVKNKVQKDMYTVNIEKDKLKAKHNNHMTVAEKLHSKDERENAVKTDEKQPPDSSDEHVEEDDGMNEQKGSTNEQIDQLKPEF